MPESVVIADKFSIADEFSITVSYSNPNSVDHEDVVCVIFYDINLIADIF